MTETIPTFPDANSGDEIEYVEALEDLFLVIRKQGLMLSPADRDCVRGWYREGIPLRIAAQSITDEIDLFREKRLDGTPVPHAISTFSRAVHRAWKTSLEQQFRSEQLSSDNREIISEQTATHPVNDEKESLLKRLEQHGKTESHPSIREAYRSLYKRLHQWEKARQNTSIGHWQGLLVELEVLLIQEILEILPKNEKEQVNNAIQARFHKEKRGLGKQAKAACLFNIQTEELRQRYGLIELDNGVHR